MRRFWILHDTPIWRIFSDARIANLLIVKIHNPKYINNGLFWLFLEILSTFCHGDGQSRVVLPLPNEAMLHSIWHSNLTSFFRRARTQNTLIMAYFGYLYLELFLPFHHGDGQSRWCYRCQMRRCCRARRSPCCRLTSRCPRILCNLCIVVIKVIAYKFLLLLNR